jgi:poly(ADP-ribose) glycohydrolase ARH3
MRVAPIGLWGRGDVEATAAMAHEQARITHAHDLAKDAAAVQACLVGSLAHDPPTGVEEARRCVHAVLAAVPVSSGFREGLDALAELHHAAAAGDVVAGLGNGVAAAEAVPAAIQAFLRTPDDPVETVRWAVALGGDADTIAAMAGALSGAWRGASAFPAAWLDRLEARAHLEDLAARLASRRA